MDSRRRRRKEAVKVEKIIDIFPSEILHDVLLRLDVKDLIRFRYVSKACNMLVSDPCFRNMHFHQTKKNLKGKLMIQSDYSKVYSLDDEENFNQVVPTEDPLFRKCSRIWGSCNGLLCLMSPSNDLYICNPSTREYKKLPLSPALLHTSVAYGFGCDPDVYDYEVVGVGLYSFSYYSIVEIYSLRENSWRTIRNIPYYTVINRPGQFVNGSLHWVASTKFCIVLIAFAIGGGERFREIQLPAYDAASAGFSKANDIYVEEYERQLCMLEMVSTTVELWVMKDYGVIESWTKLFTISSPLDEALMKPLCITNNGLVLLHVNGGFFTFNPNSSGWSYLTMDLGWQTCEARAYVESFVGLVINK